MTRQTAQDFAPEVLRLFDQYVHGLLDRRGFLQSAAKYTVGAVTAEALLAAPTSWPHRWRIWLRPFPFMAPSHLMKTCHTSRPFALAVRR
jgi:hypothetical protein